jgi:hypothetical protein
MRYLEVPADTQSVNMCAIDLSSLIKQHIKQEIDNILPNKTIKKVSPERPHVNKFNIPFLKF